MNYDGTEDTALLKLNFLMVQSHLDVKNKKFYAVGTLLHHNLLTRGGKGAEDHNWQIWVKPLDGGSVKLLDSKTE